jgi:glycosyltransferase involved in cell wall biosynthesis
MDGPDRLRIVHVFRAPVGGVFRHVADLARAQSASGHAVGLVCDSLTGGAFEERILAALADRLSLGVTRFAMRRNISPSDLAAIWRMLRHLTALAPDVIHCHGAKGGVYGRLIGGWLKRRRSAACFYAPHGGSLHYEANSLEGRVYFLAERLLERLTDSLVHVSAYEAEAYRRKVGAPRCPAAIIPNGLNEEEFTPVTPRDEARDLLFLGNFRDLKGTDLFLVALAKLETSYGRTASAHLFGQAEGDGLKRYQALAASLGIAGRVAFHDPAPAREAFSHARAIVVPSRAESMPYVVLEAIAAGLPIVATRVGGIPEIFGPHADALVAPGDPDALAARIEHVLSDPARAQHEAAARLEWVRPRFAIEAMQRRIETLYREGLARRRPR